MYGGLDAKRAKGGKGIHRISTLSYGVGTGVESNHEPCTEGYSVHTMILLWLVSAMEFNVYSYYYCIENLMVLYLI